MIYFITNSSLHLTHLGIAERYSLAHLFLISSKVIIFLNHLDFYIHIFDIRSFNPKILAIVLLRLTILSKILEYCYEDEI